MSSLLRSSKFIRYCATAARSLVANANTRCAPETGHLSLIQSNSSAIHRYLATQATGSSQYSTNLERSLQQLDQDVRRTGRISRKELEEVLEEIKQTKNATSSQSLLVIRCCGSLIPEELPEVRTQLVKRIWSTMENLKVPMDISHYNALLRVFLENEHDFSPAEFLQELEKKGIEPNRVTYQRLITRYCQQGDIEGATRILEFMREKSLPVNESVFNALIMGHSQSEDMESAVGILAVMKQAGLEPSADTYTTLLVGYAKRGDIEKIKEVLAECDKSDNFLLGKDYLDIVYALATNGHAAFVDGILERIRKSAGFNQDAISLIFRLINKGQEEVALKVLRLMPRHQKEDSDTPSNQGIFLVKQLVKAQRPVESILNLCRTLEEEGLNNKALSIAVETSLSQQNVETAIKLMKALRESGAPLRQHYFWPLFCSAGQAKDDDKIVQIIGAMINEFNMHPSSETVREYIVPNLTISNKDQIITLLKQAGVSSGSTVNALVHECLQQHAINEAANLAARYRAFFPPELMKRTLNMAYLANQSATNSYLDMIHYIYEGIERQAFAEGDAVDVAEEQRNLVGNFLLDLLKSARGPINLIPVLQGLTERGLRITSEAADQIQGRLSGELLTNKISELLVSLTSEDLQATQAARKRLPASAYPQDEASLKNRIRKLEEQANLGPPGKRSLLQLYCKVNETEKAKSLLQDLGDEAGPGLHAVLIDSLTEIGRLDDALDQLNQLSKAYPDATLDPLKIVRLVEALFKQDKVEEGLHVLERHANGSRKLDDIPFGLRASAFQLLNTLAEKGDVQNLEKAFELLLKSNLVEVTNVLLGPLVKVHVLKNDMPAAINKLSECVEKYKMTPWKSELTKKLIDAEDAATLQKITDISSKVHGEINSLYDLVFAFVECGRIRQARKILETPGMRNRQNRLSVICERYQEEGSVAALEGLIEATRDMNHIDRRDIFNQLLNAYIKSDNTEKALGVWTQMQEDDVQPSDAFLISLADFLERKGLDVPFVKPSLKKTKVTSEAKEKKSTPNKVVSNNFKNAIKAKDWATAKQAKAELESHNVPISPTDLSLYIEGLCQSENIDEASQVVLKTLQSGVVPNIRIFRFFTNKLCSAADVDMLAKIGDLIDNNTKKLISFDNKLTGAYLNGGRAVEVMDKLLTEVEAASPEDVAALNDKFPRGAISGILENNPALLPKYERIADKYYEFGSQYPANCLWMSLFMTPGLESRADETWQKYSLAEMPRPMFQRVLAKARESRDMSLLHRLVNTLKNSKVTEPALGVVHSAAIDVLVGKEGADAALEYLKSSLNDVSLENIGRNSLVRLETALKNEGKEFPYKIPDKKTQASSSSSSSSSDDEREELSASK